MRVLIYIIFLCAPFLLQAMPYENVIIEKIDISIVNLPPGAEYSSNAILSRMKTKKGDLFSQITFDNDLKTLSQEFDRIEPVIDVVDQHMFLTLKIWLKPHIRTILFEGNDFCESDDLQKELGIAPGVVFDRLAFTKAFHKLKAFYVKKGFFEAELDYSVAYDNVTNEVDVTISIQEGRSGKIKEIVFNNFTSEEEEDINETLVTKKWSFFTSWITNEGIYNEEAMQHDQFMMINYMQNKGYADAKVFVEVKEADSCNRIIIVVTLERGQQYFFGDITFEGNCIFSNEDVRDAIQINEGGLYSPDKLRNTVLSLLELYGNCGYIDAIVDYEPCLETEKAVYSVHFTIEEGEPYRIGLIKVFGNCSTQTNVILHECLLIPGEVFNTSKLSKTEERLRNIGYFETVNVYAVKSESVCNNLDGNYRDVHIEVKETSTGNFSAFFGFSNVESLFGGFHLTEKNFNYKGISKLCQEGFPALRGGGEYAHFTTSVGTKSRSYHLSWTKPYFRDTPWIVGFDLEQSNVRYISRDYDINGFGGMLHAKYPINPYLRFGWHYRLRNTTVKVTGDGDESRQLREEAKNGGLISASGISLVYDSTDCPQRPTLGFRSRLEMEYAGLGGDHSFLGLGYLNTWYYPLSKRGVIKIRGDLKFLIPTFDTSYATMPIDERLFLGGDTSVRGYRPFSIGPKFNHTTDPRGGLSLNLISLEYAHRFSKRWEGFVFFDAGHLSKNTWSIGDFKSSAGLGLRVVFMENSPPLTLGMGFPINPTQRSDIKRFFFSLGGTF